jgi:hypothetical protein
MDPRGPSSDTSSFYSGSTGSVWSTTDSVSFVYTDDPDWAWWGYENIRGAVTRKDDKRDNHRVRFAAHFLRGPFAGKSKKKHHGSSSSSSHRRDSDARSTYSNGSSGSSSSSRRHRQSPVPMPMPMHMPPPPHAYPGSPHHAHPEMHHPQHFDHFPHGGPPMDMGPPPPPPQQPGFEAGFIQLGGGGPPPQQQDPVWGHNAQFDGAPEVWD